AHESFDADRFGELEETVQRHDGYTAEARTATILEGLGLPEEVHRRPLSTLSGGFKLRVLLAQVLASAPDVLLLDEPTNHLDILSIRWLEKFLHDFRGPVVVISHDHRFLDNVASKILDVDYSTVTLYHGNYTFFLEQKREERERREKEIEGRQKEIAHHQEFVDRFRAKNTKARQAQSKLRMIEKKAASLEALPGSSRRYPTFRFKQQRPTGRDVLTVKGVEKSFGDNEVLHGVDLLIRRGERVAIIGPNGIGKSTLLKIAMGELAPDAGAAEWGYEAQPGYFAQDHHEQLEGDSGTAEEWLWRFCPDRDRGFVRGWMGMMLFSGDEGAKQLSALSGGEAARLVFSKIMLDRPNVLVLDEPTNHLDLESIEALVEGLRDYDGTIILVSHDRWFVGELATRVVEISAAGVRDYHGTYEEYVHALGDDHLDADAVLAKSAKKGKDGKAGGAGAGSNGSGGSAASPSKPKSKPTSNPFKLNERREEVTARIEAQEARLKEIEQAFCDPDIYSAGRMDEVRALEEERGALRGEVEALMGEWEELERELERSAT
ncbi:MAG: ABC-F family ATP-binding cassette domain-containing protein, partial [Gemmatimonadetes bacterium]|nr:ABC-F family ATP-binding cassette domain-containing protein [Gemmatimonadota bacterium]